ncbi:MAG: dihydrofolate reductase family protein [Thermoleophilaceae bacterium]
MAGRVQYYCASSLDGFIAESDDTLAWLTGYQGSYDGADAEASPMQDGGSYERFYDGVGALVMGSATYRFLLDHQAGGGSWPYAGKPTWVLTSRDLPEPEGEDADVRIGPAKVEDIHDETLAAAGERDVWLVGGGNVASQYADAGLLDELLLTIVPVVLGQGKPLFDRRLPAGAMQLTGTSVFGNGMVELRYEIAR